MVKGTNRRRGKESKPPLQSTTEEQINKRYCYSKALNLKAVSSTIEVGKNTGGAQWKV